MLAAILAEVELFQACHAYDSNHNVYVITPP